MSGKDKKMQAFSDVDTYVGLQKHLVDRANNLKNTNKGTPKYICHYTSLSAAISIIRNQKWYIGSPLNMNDGLELSHAQTSVWEKTFFASFMLEPKESIAMWSMYAQPWKDGVMIRIPVEKFKEWIRSAPSVFSADPNTKKANTDNISSSVDMLFHAVAYTNAEAKDPVEQETLWCGSDANIKMTNVLDSNELVGYVKDIAWSYENEYRLRVNNKTDINYRAVSISIPDDVIDSFEIVAGPRFIGKILDRVETEIRGILDPDHVQDSIFTGKLKWIYCDSCLTK